MYIQCFSRDVQTVFYNSYTKKLKIIFCDKELYKLEMRVLRFLVPDFQKYLELDIYLEKREDSHILRVLDGLLQGKKYTQEWK